MQHIASEINKKESVATLKDQIVPVSEIFRLQDAKELEIAERKYLPGKYS